MSQPRHVENTALNQRILDAVHKQIGADNPVPKAELQNIIEQVLFAETEPISDKDRQICIAYVKRQLLAETQQLKRVKPKELSISQYNQRITREIKSTLEGYDEVLTEDYLKFVYDEVVNYDDTLWLSRAEKEELFSTIKIHFPVDYQATSKWKMIDEDFEARLLQAVNTEQENTNNIFSDIDLRLAFIEILDRMIDDEHVLVSTEKRKLLFERVLHTKKA